MRAWLTQPTSAGYSSSRSARLALLIATVAACRGDGRSPRQADPSPAQPAGSASAPAAGPVNDPALRAVPPEVVSKVGLEEVARGLDRPVLLVVAPGDARRRLFVLEQHAGKVRILENGAVLPTSFLTIKDLSDGNEQGLLGLAFHPKYAQNGKLYVNYTDRAGDTHIDEYKVSANPDVVDPATRREIIQIKQPFSNHNGGNLVFGPDGKLYTGMGDGGSAGDPKKNGQNPQALLAKILRFDVDAPTSTPERVHTGVRNPWRFSFDPANGDLYIGDVGQDLWENVYVVGGSDKTVHNFGWNVVEGNHCYKHDDCDRTGFTAPVADYPHDLGCSVTGGVVYRGKALPQLAGRYFYADYCTGLLRSFVWHAGVIHDHWNWKDAIDPDGVLQQISSFGVDADGEVYIVELTGSIYELVPR